MSKKIILFSLLIIILSCSYKTPIKIGLIGDLSNSSSIGGMGKNGAELAISEINSSGGVNGRFLELYAKNHENSKELSFQSVKDVINQGANIIIGPFLSSMAQSVKVASINSNTLIISPTVSSENLTGLDDIFLRVIPSASNQGVSLADEVNRLGITNVLVVIDENNSDYSNAVYSGFSSNIDKNKIKADKLSLTGTIKTDLLNTYIYNKNPQVIIFITSGKDAGLILNSLSKNKSFKPKLYGATWSLASGILESSEGSAEGMIFVDYFRNINKTEREMDFIKSYKDLYGTNPNISALYAYEAVYIYADAVKNIKKTDTDKIKKYIIKNSEFMGVSENIIFDKFGDVSRKTSLYQIINNRIELIK